MSGNDNYFVVSETAYLDKHSKETTRPKRPCSPKYFFFKTSDASSVNAARKLAEAYKRLSETRQVACYKGGFYGGTFYESILQSEESEAPTPTSFQSISLGEVIRLSR